MFDLDDIWHSDASQPSRQWLLIFPQFRNPRWLPTAILKMEKLRYLHKCLTDFNEIWHGDATGTFGHEN